jgi:putative ABC transport system permease protein
MKRAYRETQTTGNIAFSFSLLAILIACMGVFGLTAYMAEQRTKEIGIRKVMGASVGNIVSLFTVNYIKLLLISFVIAIPVAWWVGDRYLQNFAYRISLSWWMFAAAALITVALTLLTVSFQAIKAATANPVKALKTE